MRADSWRVLGPYMLKNPVSFRLRNKGETGWGPNHLLLRLTRRWKGAAEEDISKLGRRSLPPTGLLILDYMWSVNIRKEDQALQEHCETCWSKGWFLWTTWVLVQYVQDFKTLKCFKTILKTLFCFTLSIVLNIIWNFLICLMTLPGA